MSSTLKLNNFWDVKFPDAQEVLHKAKVFGASVFVKTVLASPVLSNIFAPNEPSAKPIVLNGVSKKHSQLYQTLFYGSLSLVGMIFFVGSEASTSAGNTAVIIDSEQMAPKRIRYEVIETGPAIMKQVDFGSLAGRNMGKWITPRIKDEHRNPNALYSGVEQVTPESASVNYCTQMKLAWKSKMAIHGVTGATKKALPYIEDQYCNGTRTLTDLSTYVGDVDERVKVLYNNIDWPGFCATKKLSTEKCNLVKQIAVKVRGEHIVAYGMTELLPAQTHGLFNARLLDHNMRNAGLEFWMSVPALGDTLASKGLYQFTSHAIGHDGKGRAGASEVNAFLPKEYRISDSVVGPLGLKPTEHDQAAYLFIIYNIRGLINGIDDKQLSVLDAVIAEDRMDEMVEFFATSHHAPRGPLKSAQKWLSAGAKKPFKDYLKARFIPYGLKTRHNLAGLRQFLTLEKGKDGKLSDV